MVLFMYFFKHDTHCLLYENVFCVNVNDDRFFMFLWTSTSMRKTQNRSALFRALPLQCKTSCRANDGLVSQQEIMTVWVASAKPQLVTFCLLMMGVHIRRACKQKGVFNSLLLKSWSILICMAVTVLCRKLLAKLSVVCSSARRS